MNAWLPSYLVHDDHHTPPFRNARSLLHVASCWPIMVLGSSHYQDGCISSYHLSAAEQHRIAGYHADPHQARAKALKRSERAAPTSTRALIALLPHRSIFARTPSRDLQDLTSLLAWRRARPGKAKLTAAT